MTHPWSTQLGFSPSLMESNTLETTSLPNDLYFNYKRLSLFSAQTQIFLVNLTLALEVFTNQTHAFLSFFRSEGELRKPEKTHVKPSTSRADLEMGPLKTVCPMGTHHLNLEKGDLRSTSNTQHWKTRVLVSHVQLI